MITITDLKKVYHQAGREIRALDGVTLHVPADSVHGVIGQSGAGKSTLVRCLAVLDRPTSGSVEINGVELTKVRASELRAARRRLGLVFQHANLFDSRTVAGNVAYPLELAGVARQQREEKATDLLALVGLADTAGAYPAQLSGGQRQRVGIARALATDPDVLLCDEPTSALDPTTTGEILELISSLKARLGLAVVVITHEMEVVKRICDSVSLLEDGQIVESGTITDVISAFGSRLSESLLKVPSATSLDPALGRTIEILEVSSDTQAQSVAAASRHFGADLHLVWASVEQLAGSTFGRWRMLAKPPLDPAQVIAYFEQHGVYACESNPGNEVTR